MLNRLIDQCVIIMKAPLLLLAAALFSGCADSKDVTLVSKGMNKQEVTQAIGEPSKKTNIELAELWIYPELNKTIVLRADTVYDILATSTSEIDSLEESLKDLGGDIKQGVKKIGRGLDTIEDKLQGEPDTDTTANR